MLVDLHVRAEGSASAAALSELAGMARERGLDGVAITPVGAAASPKALAAAAKKSGLACFAGVELPTDRGRILAFPPSLGAEYSGRPWGDAREDGTWEFEAVAGFLSDLGYALVADQPFDTTIDSGIDGDLESLEGIHGVVVAAGTRSHFSHDRALEGALALRLAATAGTASSAQDAERLGRVATLFATALVDQGELARALRRGDAWVCQILPFNAGPSASSEAESDAGADAGPRPPRKRPRRRR